MRPYCATHRNGRPGKLVDSLRRRLLITLQSFQVVDKAHFRSLLKYQRPATLESDIPHRHTIQRRILEKAQAAVNALGDTLRVSTPVLHPV